MEVSLQSFKKRFTYDPQKDLLGKGGFGEVYKAYDNEDHIFVALKISQGTADDKYNLINEMKRFKKISHPNIVKHIEAYEVNTGSTDIHGKPILYHVGILEYADRGTLADLLKKGTPDYRIIEDLAKDIIEGLAYLHTNNIIHRDLKPSNILLFSEGEKLRAKITDFGIAKNSDATAASTQLVGTVEYMAPEFFSTGNITPAADVWSLGVMLLEALTGTHPFGKTTQGLSNEQIINNILNKDLSTATANLTEPLKKIITDCLRREVVLRAQSADALKAELVNPTADAFTEKTQVIDLKKPTAKTQPTEPKWKRWGKALFDFDVRNGKWNKIVARELLLVLFSFPIVLILRFNEYYSDMGHLLGKDLEYKTERLYSKLKAINEKVAEESGNRYLVKQDSLFLHRNKEGELKFISKLDFFSKVNSDEKREKFYFYLAEFYKEHANFLHYDEYRKMYGEYKFEDLFNEYVDEIKKGNFDEQLLTVFSFFFGLRYFLSIVFWAIKTLRIS